MLLAAKDADNVQLKFSTSTVGGANAVRRRSSRVEAASR